MSKSIISFINTDIFIISFSIFTLIVVVLEVTISVWIGRKCFIRKMDIFFIGHEINSGIIFNLQRAGSYGAAMLFPNVIGKKLYKSKEISSIKNKDKWPYILCLLLLPFLFSY